MEKIEQQSQVAAGIGELGLQESRVPPVKLEVPKKDLKKTQYTMMDNRQLRARANIVYVVVVLFAVAIAVKLFTIQMVEGDKWRAKAETISTTYRIVQPDRGHIYSEDGRLLATSVPEYEVRMDMVPSGMTQELFDSGVDSLSRSLANLFGDRTAAEYKRDLIDARHRKERFHLVKRRADHTQVQELRTFSLFRLGRYKGGLITEKHTVRVHPFGSPGISECRLRAAR